ncbi:MAG: adenosine kinase [Gammaproteobacteria bacterium]|nr:adenosine kinase [Gammaproteobacteria bacterium]
MKTYDIYGIGNALLDSEYAVSDSFLVQHSIDKGRMTLIDRDRRATLLGAVAHQEPNSVGAGGSAANSTYAAQGFGCQNYFAGVVRNDAVGLTFSRELSNAGIDSLAATEKAAPHSGQCIIFVTEDGQRSMNTYLGISETLDEHHVEEHVVACSSWAYIEGYLVSSSTGCAAARRTREIAVQNGAKTSLTLADVSIVRAFREAMNEVIGDALDLVFCNIEEALEWCETDRLDTAAKRILDIARYAVITVSEKGCYLTGSDGVTYVAGFPVQPVDSNGAGDMFAGAFLAALQQGSSMEQAARFANYAASHVVQIYGPRLPSFGKYSSIARSFSQTGT